MHAYIAPPRRGKCTKVEVFDLAATTSVKPFSSECAGPVSPRCCCCTAAAGDDHGRVRRVVRGYVHNATLRTHAHTHTHTHKYTILLVVFIYVYYLYLYVWHEIRCVCKITPRDIIAKHVYIIIYCYVRASATDAHIGVCVVCRLIGDSVGGARSREIV